MATTPAEATMQRRSTPAAAAQRDCNRSETGTAYQTPPLVARDPSGDLVAGVIRIPLVTLERKPQARSPFIPFAELTTGERGIVQRWLWSHHPALAKRQPT